MHRFTIFIVVACCGAFLFPSFAARLCKATAHSWEHTQCSTLAAATGNRVARIHTCVYLLLVSCTAAISGAACRTRHAQLHTAGCAAAAAGGGGGSRRDSLQGVQAVSTYSSQPSNMLRSLESSGRAFSRGGATRSHAAALSGAPPLCYRFTKHAADDRSLRRPAAASSAWHRCCRPLLQGLHLTRQQSCNANSTPAGFRSASCSRAGIHDSEEQLT